MKRIWIKRWNWKKGDLFEILNMVLAKLEDFASDFSGLTKIMKTSTSKKNQKQEIATHYDIGNEFFELWLDETMSYSCGYFKHETDTFYDAQVHKVEHILKKLNLKRGSNPFGYWMRLGISIDCSC